MTNDPTYDRAFALRVEQYKKDHPNATLAEALEKCYREPKAKKTYKIGDIYRSKTNFDGWKVIDKYADVIVLRDGEHFVKISSTGFSNLTEEHKQTYCNK